MSYRKKKRAPANPRQAVLTGMNADVHGTEELLATGELYSGQPYQRPVLDRVVDKLVREWDPVCSPRWWSATGMGAIIWWTANTGCAPCERRTAARM